MATLQPVAGVHGVVVLREGELVGEWELQLRVCSLR